MSRVTAVLTSKILLYEYARPSALCVPAYRRAFFPVKPAPALAVGEPDGPRSIWLRMSSGAGAEVSPSENWTSASWVASEAPLFFVMSRRKCW